MSEKTYGDVIAVLARHNVPHKVHYENTFKVAEALEELEKELAASQAREARLREAGNDMLKFAWHVGACASFTGNECDCEYIETIRKWHSLSDTGQG